MHTQTRKASPSEERLNRGDTGALTHPTPTLQPAPKGTHREPQPKRRDKGKTRTATTNCNPRRELAKRRRNPNAGTRNTDANQQGQENGKLQAKARAPNISRKPSVHSQDTEAGRDQETGVKLQPKASAALGLEAEHATPKHLRTHVPRPRRWHALGSGYARKSG